MLKGLWIACCLLYIHALGAQELAQVSNVYVLKGGFVINHPQASPVIQDIVIKDGLIHQVGSSIPAPIEAHVITADSMYIYAGFIAPASHIGMLKPKEKEREEVKQPGSPPNDVAGITPELPSATFYTTSEASIAAMRKVGFGIAHALPYGKMMAGQTAIISLNNKEFSQAVLVEDYGLYAQFEGASRMFPATKIGIIAKWREMYRNAQLANTHLQQYTMNPLNRKRPTQDPAITALIPVVEKKQRVFFRAEQHVDLQRVLQLQEELGFEAVVVENKRGDMSITKAQKQKMPILLSLDLPKELKKSEKKDSLHTRDQLLINKKKQSIHTYESVGALMAQANISKGYSFMGVKPTEILPNIRRMITAGMSESQALAHLTTLPAELLQIEKIAGTIEKGKIANIVIATHPIFDEKSKIKMVMVDGIIHKYETKKKKNSKNDQVDIVGLWSYKIAVPGIEPTGTIEIKKGSDGYDLNLTNSTAPGSTYNLSDIDLDNNNMNYSLDLSIEGTEVKLNFDIEYDSDTFEGNVDIGPFGTYPITGQKEQSPE